MSAIADRTIFHNLEALDRCRAFALGLPVPLWYNKDIPWGYDLDPNDPDMCIPDEKALRLLYETIKHIKNDYSIRSMATWLSDASGRPISYTGLCQLMNKRPPFEEIFLPLEERMKANGLVTTITKKQKRKA